MAALDFAILELYCVIGSATIYQSQGEGRDLVSPSKQHLRVSVDVTDAPGQREFQPLNLFLPQGTETRSARGPDSPMWTQAGDTRLRTAEYGSIQLKPKGRVPVNLLGTPEADAELRL